jgi:hypothetical protein
MSSTCSRPTATRIRPWPMPAAWRCSSVRRPCEVVAEWLMMVLVSPRLVAMLMTCALSITLKAFWRSVCGSAAAHVERQHGAAQPGLLAHRQRVLRMRLQAGVVHARHGGMRLEERATASALAHCACMRMPSVSRPLSTTQALNGASVMPAVRTMGANTS